jgi:hypothetical protein
MSFYDDASWLLIPEGIEEDIVFAQKPTNGTGDLTFTRASDATRTNSAGVIERTPWNLLEQSETFANAYWLKLNATITADTTTAPNGTTTADSLVESSTNGIQEIYRTPSPTRAGTFTYSVYVKNLSGTRFLNLSLSGTTSSDFVSVRFSPSTQSLSSVVASGTFTSSSASFTSVGNSWYRVVLTFTTTSLPIPQIALSTDGSNGNVGGFGVQTYTGNGTSGIFIWGAQLVEGTDAKPYFATTDRQNVPRLDYRNADGSLNSCPRLLLEPQRTNLVPNGVLFNTQTGVSYDSSITASPAPGVQNATRITKNEAAGNVRYASQNASATLLAGSSVYTLSRYFKYDGFDFQTTMEFNNSGNWGGVSWTVPVNISSTSITIGTPTACTASVVNVGSGWYRVTATITTGTTPSGFPTYLMRLPSTLSTGQGFLTALPQMELGAYASTFIPTTTAAVTRLADLASKTGISSLIGQTEGTIFLNMQYEVAQIARFSLSDGTGTNWIFFSYPESGVLSRVYINASGVLQVNAFTGSVFTANQTYKMAFAYKSGSWALYINGASVLSGTQTFSFSATLDRLLLSSTGNSATNPTEVFGKINQAALFPTRLTNAQLAQLTT